MYCTQCGSKNDDNNAFCEECGHSLAKDQNLGEGAGADITAVMPAAGSQASVLPHDSSAQTTMVMPSVNAQVPPASPIDSQVSQMPQQHQQSSKSSKKVAIVVIVAIIAIIAIGVGVFFAINPVEDDASESASTAQSAESSASQEQAADAKSSNVLENVEKSDHVVVFETNGGTTYEKIEIKAGDVITSPVDPTKPGYAFDGWYLNSNGTDAVNFPYTVKQDDPATLIIYAGWTDSNDQSHSDYDDGLFPESSETYLSNSDLKGLSKDEIQRAINEIYARNGYIFQTSKSEKRYFESQPWYVGTETNMEKVRSKFNKYELANEKLLTKRRSQLG